MYYKYIYIYNIVLKLLLPSKQYIVDNLCQQYLSHHSQATSSPLYIFIMNNSNTHN